ncbi:MULTISPECIES: hypothetical protein [unclassified Sphingomonas]|uniref:hypothetical protein n=1 Tax=Sphingomonas sp. PvP015 TaxID=3156388 RepID=UPI0033931650
MTDSPPRRDNASDARRETPSVVGAGPKAPWMARAAEMAAIFMVGDGLIGLTQPRRHVDLWKDDALGSETLVAPFVDRPARRRLYAVLQIAAGLALAARQRP